MYDESLRRRGQDATHVPIYLAPARYCAHKATITHARRSLFTTGRNCDCILIMVITSQYNYS